VGAQWQVSDKRYDNAANTTVLGGYSIVNLDLQHKLSSDWRVLARVDNFFDKKYQLANTYVTNPMTVFVGVRWSPKI
jgi:vitamin B12 transporter